MSHDHYENPLITRYASKEMSRLFSAQRRHSLWRQLWVWLAFGLMAIGAVAYLTGYWMLEELIAHFRK